MKNRSKGTDKAGKIGKQARSNSFYSALIGLLYLVSKKGGGVAEK